MLPVVPSSSTTSLVESVAMAGPTLFQGTSWPQIVLLAIYVPSGISKVLVPHLCLSPLWPTIPKRTWRPAGLYEIYAVSSWVWRQQPGWLYAYMGGVCASLAIVPHALCRKLRHLGGPVGPWCATLTCTAWIAFFTSPSFPNYSALRAILWGLAGVFVTVGLHVFSPNREQGWLELQQGDGKRNLGE